MVGPFKATCAEGVGQNVFGPEVKGRSWKCSNCGQEKDIGHQLLWEGDSAYVAVTTGCGQAPLGRGGPWGR